MSRGQKPRWPAYFPHMKDRGRFRRHGVRLTVWDSNFRAVWPPVLRVDGQTIRVDRGTLRINNRVLDKRANRWMDVTE